MVTIHEYYNSLTSRFKNIRIHFSTHNVSKIRHTPPNTVSNRISPIAEGSDCTTNYKCPFGCGIKPYRTNKELLSHCDKDHQDLLGNNESWLLETLLKVFKCHKFLHRSQQTPAFFHTDGLQGLERKGRGSYIYYLRQRPADVSSTLWRLVCIFKQKPVNWSDQ